MMTTLSAVLAVLGISLGVAGCHPMGGCDGKLDQAAITPSQSCLTLAADVCNAFSPDVSIAVKNGCSSSLVIDNAYLALVEGTASTTEIAAGAAQTITPGDKGATRNGRTYHYAIPAKLGSADLTITVDAEDPEDGN
jgi:hypothetical protein